MFVEFTDEQKYKIAESIVGLGMQAGDETSSSILAPHWKLLKIFISDEFSKESESYPIEFHFILRISGSLWHWEKSGPGNLRVSAKHQDATIDIFVPLDVSGDGDHGRIKSFLSTALIDGFRQMLDRAAKKKMINNADSLLTRFVRSIDNYRQAEIA